MIESEGGRCVMHTLVPRRGTEQKHSLYQQRREPLRRNRRSTSPEVNNPREEELPTVDTHEKQNTCNRRKFIEDVFYNKKKFISQKTTVQSTRDG